MRISNLFYLIPALLSLLLLLFNFRLEDVLLLAVIAEAVFLFSLYVSKFVARNIFRKFVHIAGVIIFIYFLLLELERLPLTVISFSIFVLSAVAHYKPRIFPKSIKNLAEEGIMNILQFWIAVLILLLFMPYRFIIISLLAFLGDTAAYFVGTKFGRTRVNGKTLEGSSAFFIVAFLLIFIFTNNLLLSLTAAIVAAIVELFTKKIDDNFTVPVVVAVFAYAVSLV